MGRIPATLHEVENGFVLAIGPRSFVFTTWEEAARAFAAHFEREPSALGAATH